MQRFPGIFNDVLAPVTPGPSSSNTCGVARMAYLCRHIFGDAPPAAVRLEMSQSGNFPVSFRGMRSHQAFAHGILGRQAWENGFFQACEDAEAAGIDIQYGFCSDIPGDPPELMRVIMAGKDGVEVRVEGASLGGGNIEISRVDGRAVSIRGDQYELLVKRCGEIEECLRRGRSFGELNSCKAEAGDGFHLIQFGFRQKITPEDMAFIAGGGEWRMLPPVTPSVYINGKEPPFTTCEGLEAFVRSTGAQLWEAAVRYEGELSGWSDDEIMAYAGWLWDIVEGSIAEGGSGEDVGFLEYSPAGKLKRAGYILPVGIAEEGGMAALNIMEHANRGGLVVGMPTVGSAGIVPGALTGAAARLGLGRKDILRGLMSAGLIGTFMAKTNFFGSLGCQMEVGCAAGMAAGGLAAMLGGDAKKACAAASMALQNYIGLVCDTVAGQVVSPCLVRNVSAVGTAASCANMALSGIGSVIPLEEMVDAMMRVGAAQFSMKCGRMGARGTDSGQRIARMCSTLEGK